MPTTTRPSPSYIFVKIRNYWCISIIPKVFNFECYNLPFLGSYIPPKSPTILYDTAGTNDNLHESVIGHIHLFLSKNDLIPFIIANLSNKPMRTHRSRRRPVRTFYELCTQIALCCILSWLGTKRKCSQASGSFLSTWEIRYYTASYNRVNTYHQVMYICVCETYQHWFR